MMKRRREEERDSVPFALAPELTNCVSDAKMKEAIAEVATLVARFMPVTSSHGTGLLDRLYSVPQPKGVAIYFVFRPFQLDIGNITAIESHRYVNAVMLMTTGTDMTLSVAFADPSVARCPFITLTPASDVLDMDALPSLVDSDVRKKALRLANSCANLPLLTGWPDFADALTSVSKTADRLTFTFVHGSFSLEPLVDVQRASCVDNITIEVFGGAMQLTLVFNDAGDVVTKKRKNE